MTIAKSSVNTSLGPGSQLDHGKYQVIRLLGRGGMGSVYEAENLRTHKRVAIKSVNPSYAENEQLTQRLAREAQAAARIRHPNVVDVYDVITEGDALYLVMEYLEGEPLTQQLKRGGLAPYALISLLLPALHGVAAAHKRGVIHRDLKPDNIFLARDDSGRVTAKVLDFGISKLQERGADQLSLTGAGNVLGTPHYMSVEQLSGAKDIDGRSDVYAIGIILYEALTGRLPFEADTFPELIYKITSTDPPEIKQIRAELPRTLARLVRWTMARDRDDRIASMDALIAELEPFATAHGWNAELTLPGSSAIQPIPPRNRSSSRTTAPSVPAAESSKRSRLLISLAATISIACALGAWRAARPPAEEPAAITTVQPAAVTSSPLTAAAPPDRAQSSDPAPEPATEQTPPSAAEPEAAVPEPQPAAPPLGATSEKRAHAQPPKRRAATAPAPAQPAATDHPTPTEPTTPTPAQPPKDPRTFRVLAPPRANDF